MKKKFMLSMLVVGTFAFAQQKTIAKNTIDSKLVGSWSGEEDDNQEEGMHKSWIMHRFDDGKFLLLFVAVKDGKAITFTEKGQWWVDNGKFYELHKIDGKTDVYTYTILGEDKVKFKAASLSTDYDNKDYEFIDTKMKD